jgi:hypothetical protein
VIIHQAEEEIMLYKGGYSDHLDRDATKSVLSGNLFPGLKYQIISLL